MGQPAYPMSFNSTLSINHCTLACLSQGNITNSPISSSTDLIWWNDKTLNGCIIMSGWGRTSYMHLMVCLHRTQNQSVPHEINSRRHFHVMQATGDPHKNKCIDANCYDLGVAAPIAHPMLRSGLQMLRFSRNTCIFHKFCSKIVICVISSLILSTFDVSRMMRVGTCWFKPKQTSSTSSFTHN